KVDTSDDEGSPESTDACMINATNLNKELSQQMRKPQKRKLDRTSVEIDAPNKNNSSSEEDIYLKKKINIGIENISSLPDDTGTTSNIKSKCTLRKESLMHIEDKNEHEYFYHERKNGNISGDIKTNMNVVKNHDSDQVQSLASICPNDNLKELNTKTISNQYLDFENLTELEKDTLVEKSMNENIEILNKSESSLSKKHPVIHNDGLICPYIQLESDSVFPGTNEKTVNGKQGSSILEASNGDRLPSRLEETEEMLEDVSPSQRKTMEKGESAESLFLESEEEYRKPYKEKAAPNCTLSSTWNGSKFEDNKFVPITWKREVKARVEKKENGKIKQRIDVT
ncbi:unnamed protein product, partial [Meganyctiphanes norvegica]